uniref:Uncharacterized protein n=1 Tax=Lepeophtheirus salmonis TaxID=72036 RepID=A0A0K2UKJ1_LEPSM
MSLTYITDKQLISMTLSPFIRMYYFCNFRYFRVCLLKSTIATFSF